MVEAILKGERRAGELVALCDPQILKKKETALRAALEGSWKKELSLRVAAGPRRDGVLPEANRRV